MDPIWLKWNSLL